MNEIRTSMICIHGIIISFGQLLVESMAPRETGGGHLLYCMMFCIIVLAQYRCNKKA